MNPLGMWTHFRSIVESYVSVLGPRFIGLIWVGAISGIIWIFGPRMAVGDFAPLVPERNRLIAIAVVVVLWLVWAIFSWWRKRRADAALASGVTETPEVRAAAETRAEIGELRDRLREAMTMMRKVARRRFGYAYEFPWYLMMGAPGAGKTTLVTRSGLRFPLGDALKAEPVQGVGGTRNCNWWFTDKAILIDTAGRYTTQESGHARDSAGFLGFLSMLRRRRRAQPINGVILALSLTDLLTQKPEDRLRDIRATRQRMAEIEETLGARIPVYLVLTKADRLPGFPQFFETFGAQAREQVWGMTFPLSETRERGRLPQIFLREYRGLLERLNAMLIERLQQEQDIDRRGRIFRFPAQVAALEAALQEVVEELSSGSDKVSEPLIRGVYFASATQEDMVAAPSAIPQPSRAMNRSFFVNRLFSDVILGEAALVGRDVRVSRRKKIVTGVGYAVASLAALFLAGSWFAGFTHNRQALIAVDDGLAQYQALAAAIPVREIDDADFLRLLPALNQLASLPGAFEGDDGPLPLHRVSLGMDRSGQISESHKAAYERALGALFLPRYMVALQNRLKRDDISDAEVFETLKHYLSLAGLGPIDPDALIAQSERIFDDLYPGSGRASTREALRVHLVAMLERGDLPILQIDDNLVAKSRERMAGISPAQRVIDLLASRDVARAIPDWSLERAVGPAGAQAFSFASGAPVDQTVSGLLTRRGYQAVVLPQIAAMAEIAAGESWVRGPGAPVRDTPSTIASDAIDLYWTRFSDDWRRVVSDITVRPVSSLEDAAKLVLLVSSQVDPLGRLAASIGEETALVPDDATALPDPGLLPFDALAAPDPYGPLRRALEVTGEGEAEGNALTALQPVYDALYQQLVRATATDVDAAEVFAANSELTTAAQDLAAAGRRLPSPVDVWVVGLAAKIAAATVVEARTSVNELWQAEGANLCRSVVEGRYPFATATGSDVPIDDFTRLFGPGGVFDLFFADNLAEFVDTSSTPWSWKGGLGTAGDASDALMQFQRAAIIRSAFFPTGGSRPNVQMTVRLVKLDPDGDSTIFTIGKQSSNSRTPERVLVWPPEDGELVSLIRITPYPQDFVLRADGPWAPFRLFDQGEIVDGVPGEFDVTFDVNGRNVTLRIRSGSVNNPFRLPALTEFRCPERL
ncbi:MAG: type VI secretion system membrane subunit TssM [Tabrizicola sp.]|nr:type VI secretion system membrane subunit TssM [Tabrizicola sp.]